MKKNIEVEDSIRTELTFSLLVLGNLNLVFSRLKLKNQTNVNKAKVKLTEKS